MAFKNGLFYLGQEPITNSEPYRSPEIAKETEADPGHIKGMQSGSPISAADFNTILRGTSLVTYSLLNIIQSPSSVNDVPSLTFDMKQTAAQDLIKENLNSYIADNIKVKKSYSVVPDGKPTGATNTFLYNDSSDETRYVSSSISNVGVVQIPALENGNAVLASSDKISTNNAKFIHRDEDGENYKLDFSLDASTKTLTIKWVKQ